jgi:tetratricopeptide (TPR) repeat protein
MSVVMRTLLVLACACRAVAAAGDDRPLEPGDLVMPAPDCEIRSQGESVPLKGRLLPFTVQSVNGDQVDIGCGTAPAASLVRLKEADAFYTERLKSQPRSVDTLHLRACARMELQDWPGAIADFDAAIEIIPNVSRLYTKRAVAYICYRDPVTKDLKYPQRARDDCNRALELNPNEVWAVVVRFRLDAYFAKNADGAARADIHRLQFIAAQDADTCQYRGVLFQVVDAHALALRDFDKALDLDPHCARLYAYRGQSLRALGRKAESARDFETAVRLSPNDAYIYRIRAYYYMEEKQQKLAIADLEKAIELLPDGATLASLAEALCWLVDRPLRDPRRGKDLALRAYELDPHDWHVLRARGIAHAEHGEFAEAEEFLRKALEMKRHLGPKEREQLAEYINIVRTGKKLAD